MLEKGQEDKTCDHCGAMNVMSYTRYPERDKGTLRWQVAKRFS